jgi:hypothetical protein
MKIRILSLELNKEDGHFTNVLAKASISLELGPGTEIKFKDLRVFRMKDNSLKVRTPAFRSSDNFEWIPFYSFPYDLMQQVSQLVLDEYESKKQLDEAKAEKGNT